MLGSVGWIYVEVFQEDGQTVSCDIGWYILPVFDLEEDNRDEVEVLEEVGGVAGREGLAHHLHEVVYLLFYLLR